MQVAGHCQIQNLQLAIFGVAVLVILLRQGNALLLHVAAGADEDAVIVAPCREAQPGVLLQILDREQDIGAVLDDLAEQPAQGVAALVQHTGCIQDSAVDAAALEDADILQRYAVGGKQVIGVQLNGVDAAQLLNGRPAGHHSAHSGSSSLQTQRRQTGHQHRGKGCAHAQHGSRRSHGAVDPAAEQQEGYAAEHCRRQQDTGHLPGTALAGTLAEALLHKVIAGGLYRAAQQHPRVLLFQIPGEGADQVFIAGAVSAPQFAALCCQRVAALHGSQHHPAAHQRQKHPQRSHTGQQTDALGATVGVGIQHGHHRLQQGRHSGQRGHGVRTGTAAQTGQTVPQHRVAHKQAGGKQQQIGGIERRRGSVRVQHRKRRQQTLCRQPKVQQHHGQNASQHTPQGQFCSHVVQLVGGGFRHSILGRGSRLRFRCGLQLCRGRGSCRCGYRGGSLRCGGAVLLQREQGQAHSILFFRLAGSGLFVLCRAEHLENRLFLRLFWQRFRVCRRAGKHHRRQLLGGVLCSLCRGFLRLCRRLCRRGLHLGLWRCLYGLCGLRGRLCLAAHAVEHILQLLHLPLLQFLLRQQRLRGVLRLRLLLGGCNRLRHRLRRGLFRLRLHGSSRLGCRHRLCRNCLGRLWAGGLHRHCRNRVCGTQFQRHVLLLRLYRLCICPQQDLAGGDLQHRLCRGGRLFLVVAEQLAQQPGLGLFLHRGRLVPAGHLLGQINHTGAEKVAETLLCRELPRLLALAFICIVRHPCPSHCSGWSLPLVLFFYGALRLDLVQDNACRHRNVIAVHAGAGCSHIQPHHAVTQLLDQLGYPAALAAQYQRDGACQVILAQRHAVHVGAVDKHALLLQAADGLADVGHARHRQTLGSACAGLDDGGGNGCTTPLGDDDAVGTAQQCAAHDCAQIVGVLNAIAQHQKGRLALGLGCGQQILHGRVLDLAGKGRHALMALGAGHQAQLVRVHPLDRCSGLLGQCRIVCRHCRGHPLGNEHGVHTGAALEQLGHRVFAVDQALTFLLRLLCIAARTARLVTFFHLFMLLPFRAGCAAPERFILFMIIQDKVYHISPGFATNCWDFIF